MKNRLLFFDAAASGHHGEFLENVICGLPREVAQDALILAHLSLRERLGNCKERCESGITLSFLSEEDLEYLRAARGIVQIGRRQLEVLRRHLEAAQVDHVVLMHMNLHQYAIHSWSPPEGVTISGILLNPYTSVERAWGLRAKLFAAMTGLRKRLQFVLMLRNPQIKRIFLLNDPRMAECLNRWHPSRPVFASIPDPLPTLAPKAGPPENVQKGEDAPFRFLLAGSMAPRKGCLEVLHALALLAKDCSRPVELRIIGRFREEKPDYRAQVFAEAARLGAASSRIRVYFEDSFVSDARISGEFAQADCVLVPYLEFYGSSGIIGHACRYFKPLLACHDGLIGEIVREEKLGICVNPRQTKAFAAAMQAIISGHSPYDPKSAARYVAAADHANFAKGLIA